MSRLSWINDQADKLRIAPPAAPIVAAYYYPGWHSSPDRRIGTANNEWNLLYDKSALRSFPDISRPLNGPIKPTVDSLEEEACTAARGGIDAFLWCWYWDHGRQLLNETLDLFLQCQLPHGFRYALMWVNKRPHFQLPLAREPSRSFTHARTIHTDEEDFTAMIRHLIRHHWARDSYLHIGGRPFLNIYCPELLAHKLGPSRLGKLLHLGEEMARAAGFDGIHYVAIIHRLHRRNMLLEHLPLYQLSRHLPLADLGFGAVSNYVYLPEWEGPPMQDYQAMIRNRVTEWPEFSQRYALPYWPSVSPGWDARPRGGSAHHPNAYPWAPVITAATPGLFGQWLTDWKTFSAHAGGVPLLSIASWNEWTEGHAIAPSDRHGEALLQHIRQFKSSFAGSPLQEVAGIR